MASDFAIVSGLHRLEEIEPGLLRDGNRRTARGLRAVDLRLGIRDEAELRQFLIALVDLASKEPPAIGHDRVLRQAPAELLGDFIAMLLEPSA